MTDQPLSYVFLCYVPKLDEKSKECVFVLIYREGAELEIVIRSDWESMVPLEEREYLAEMLKDWSDTSSEEVPRLLQELAGLSIGPLKALESGLLDLRRREMLIGHVYSGQPVREDSRP